MAAINENLDAFVAESDVKVITFTYDTGAVSAPVDLTAVTAHSWTAGTRTFVMTDATDTYTLIVPVAHPLLDPPPFNTMGYATTMDRLVDLLADLGVS